LVKRLRKYGALYQSWLPMITSARRWERDGWFRRMFSNWALMIAYSAGVSPSRLARLYCGRADAAMAVFARDPAESGKTRLWNALGLAPDPSLARALLADTMASAHTVRRVDRWIVHTGSRARVLPALPTGWNTLAQRGVDIGARMCAAFEDLFGLGYARVALVGSDLPTLPPAAVERALNAVMKDADVALGPAEDGGYYLIALKRPQPALFQDIAWGSASVLEQTLARARHLGLTGRCVDRWYDVDDAANLRRAADDPRARETAAWVRSRSLVS
jgi:uncharacterized protein